MKTYEEKKKMAEHFPKGTKCLVEMENVKDPKENPFKRVRNYFKIKLKIKIFNYREKW